MRSCSSRNTRTWTPASAPGSCFDVCLRKHQGEIDPVMAVHDCRMINMWRTPTEPMKTVVAEMQAAEGRGRRFSRCPSRTDFHGRTCPTTSAKMLVIADGDADLAARTARRFGGRIWSLRNETRQPLLTIGEALDAIDAGPGPVVVADVADNAGGGAPSDSTFVLVAALERGMTGLLLGYYWDPVAVRFCVEAGEGASLELRIGGKCGPELGPSGGPARDRSPGGRETVDRASATRRCRWGTTVLAFRGGTGVDLVLTSTRTQVFHPDGMTQLGIEPSGYRGVVVKSSQHFHAGFAPLAGRIEYIACEGAIAPDFAAIPYRTFRAPYWPRVENPFLPQ